jgi:hypothetical protein
VGALCALLWLLASRGAAHAASSCVWIGPAGGNFSGTAANWSSCGGTWPQPGDAVFFDVSGMAGSNTACTINAAINVASITLQNGYTQTVSASGSVPLVLGSLTVATGKLTAGSSPMQVTGNVTISGGTLSAPSGTFQIGGVFNRAGGNYTHNGGTVIFNATGAVSHTVTSSQPFNKVIINDGLVAYWNLDEGAGSALADQSGYANGLTLNAASFTSGVSSTISFSDPSALAFNGAVYAHLTTSPPTNLPAANAPETLSAWVKLGSTAATQDAVALGDGGTNGVKLGIQSSGALAAWTWGGTTLATTAAPGDGLWHQVTFSYDGTNNRLYLDGALRSTTGTAHQSGATTVADLGSYDGTHELMAAGGAIDDVRIYNRALSSIEVSALAFGSMPGTGVATHTFNGTLTTNSDLVLLSGNVTGTGGLSVSGNWLNYGGTNTATGGVTLKAASGSILSGGQLLQQNLTVSGGASYTLSDRLWATNHTVTVTGALNASGYVVHAGTLAGTGAFTAGPTVVFDNTFTTTAAATAFTNLRIEDSKNEANSVSYWKLDEGSGSKTYDLTASANTATLNGGVRWTSGASSNIGYDDAAGVVFDGATGYVSTGVGNIPKPDAKQSISLWVKLASTAGTQDFVAFNDGAGDGIKLGLNGGALAAWTWAGTSLVTATAPVDGAWHSVVYTWDGATNVLYLDGVAATSTTTGHQTGTITQGVLGSSDGTTEFLNGSLDDVRVFKTALTALQAAQLAAGRYAGTGGYSTVTLGAATTVSGALTMDAGNLNSGGFSLAVTGAASANAGTYALNGAITTASGGLTVRPGGGLTLASASSAGSLLLGSGTTLTVDGPLIASPTGGTSPTITSVSGRYTFKIGSTASATPTLNIGGLAVQNTDANGMWIGANTSATITVTEFDNVAFSNGTGTQLLQITAGAVYLGSSGCTFDGSTTYAVKAVGNGLNTTRAIFGTATCATMTSGICATSEKSDDDADNNGIADSPGNGVNLGAVVQFVRSAQYAGGTFQGLPTAAFDWNTFTYYSTYAVFRNQAGSADIVYVRDEAGNPLYSWSTGTNMNIVGTPQWTSTTVGGVTTHYLYVAVTDSSGANADKVYRLIDTGTGTSSGSLTLDASWGTNPYLCGCSIKSPASLDANNVYWAATTGTAGGGNLTQVLMEVGQSTQSVMTGWPLTAPATVTTSSPTLVSSGATTLYLGITGDILQLDVSTTSFVTNSKPGTVTGRVSYGTSVLAATTGTQRVFAGDNNGRMWAWNPANFTGTNFLWSYTAGAKIVGGYYDAMTDTIQFGTNGGAVVVLTGAGSGTSGVALTGYPLTLNAADPIASSPLYANGVLVVGSTLGKLYFIDRSTTAAGGSPSIVLEYYFGPTENVSAVAYDANVNRYMVSVSSSAKDGRLYYFDAVTDPTPAYQ